MKKKLLVAAVALVAAGSWAAPNEAYRPKLFASFKGDTCNVLDGLTQNAAGDIFMSVPNIINPAYPGVVMKRCAKSGRWGVFVAGLRNPVTGKGAPMGIEMGPDGNLYYCDNQYFYDKNYQSRIIRVDIDPATGAALRCTPVVERIKLANAVRFTKDALFFTDTYFDLPDQPAGTGKGGVYRVPLADIAAKGCVRLLDKPQAEKDPYFLGATHTKVIPGRADNSGADGLCIAPNGDLYFGTFGSGAFYTMKHLGAGTYAQPELLYANPDVWPCCDGICYYAKKNWVIITDSAKNAVRYWDIDKKQLGLIWQNGDDDGATGLLDQPCEPLVWNGKLIVVNFDMAFPGLVNQTNDEHHTLSVIDLD